MDTYILYKRAERMAEEETYKLDDIKSNECVTTQNEPRVAPTLTLLGERTNKSKLQHIPIVQLEII